MSASRELKFRAWDLGAKEMSLERVNPFDGDYLIEFRTVNQDRSAKDLLWMQYIGLKDKNHRDIYEGDIVKFDTIKFESYEAEQGLIGGVSFLSGQYTFGGCFGFFVNKGTIEVIGNVHQNKELIK